MKRLGDLFNAEKIPGFKEAHIRHTIADTLTAILGIPIKPRQIVCKDGVVYLAVPPVVKSAVNLKAAEIQNALQKEGVRVTGFK